MLCVTDVHRSTISFIIYVRNHAAHSGSPALWFERQSVTLATLLLHNVEIMANLWFPEDEWNGFSHHLIFPVAPQWFSRLLVSNYWIQGHQIWKTHSCCSEWWFWWPTIHFFNIIAGQFFDLWPNTWQNKSILIYLNCTVFNPSSHLCKMSPG